MKKKNAVPAWKPLLLLLTLLMAGLGMLVLCYGIASNLPSVLPGAEAETAAEAPAPEEESMPPDALARAQALADEEAQSLLPPPPTLEDVEGVTVDLIPESRYTRGDEPLEQVNAIVIHYTGNPGTTAKQNRDYFASLARTGDDAASSHFVICMDGSIIQCVPLNQRSYASNHRNFDTIAIECCHPDDTGAFTQETRDALVSLVRYLVKGYRLDRDGVIRHYDVTGKLCPLYYVEHPDQWESLKDDIFEDEE